ncbi:MAG: hypothetical protein ACREH8_22560, partial [Opitutaceae bacterium]
MKTELSRLENIAPTMAGLLLLLTCLGQPAFGQAGLPRPVVPMPEEILGRKPRDQLFGSLEGAM